MLAILVYSLIYYMKLLRLKNGIYNKIISTKIIRIKIRNLK